MSLFSTVNSPPLSAEIMNNNLTKISVWAYKWKMRFNPDATKQAHEVILTQKSKKPDHPTIYFNNAPVTHTDCQKHLEM